MSLLLPKIIALDSSTWGHLARDAPKNSEAKKVIEFLSDGTIVPFLSGHHILELTQHASEEVRRSRIDLICSLRFVACFRSPQGIPIFSRFEHIMETELATLLQEPSLSPREVVSRVRPQVYSGFCSGKELVTQNQEPLAFLVKSARAAEFVPIHADIASLAQTLGARQREKIPKPGTYKLRDPQGLLDQLNSQISWLSDRLRATGDAGISPPDRLAQQLIDAVAKIVPKIYSIDGPDPFRTFLVEHFGIEPSRLRKRATFEDVGYEVIFRNRTLFYDHRLGKKPGSIYESIRQEMVPSWIVWRELDRIIRSYGRADGGNLTDLMLAPLALYLEKVQVDGRVFDCARSAKKSNSLLSNLQARMFRTTGSDHEKLYIELDKLK
jgi:hypothetical protein